MGMPACKDKKRTIIQITQSQAYSPNTGMIITTLALRDDGTVS